MKLTIHRGSHEIGGNCIELTTQSGKTRVVIDVGMPLVTKDRLPFDWHHYKDLTQDQLVERKILPSVHGLYSNQEPLVSAVVLSHAHQDHYGFFRFIHPDIPLYMSAGTRSLVEVSNVFLDTGVDLGKAETFSMRQPFRVGEFSITPYLMDHSAPDAAAFHIEADGQRLFYTGDFRGHGRKRVLLERLTKNPVSGIDCLVMEGSMIGRDEGQYPDETSVERAIYDVLIKQQSYTFVFCSSQNLDRLVSVYRAVKRARKALVIDLYTAFILDKLSSLSPKIPQFASREIRVLYAYSHAQKLAGYNKELLYKYRKARIKLEGIRANPQDMVILSKDNRYFRMLVSKLGVAAGAKGIYSMWDGYLGRTDLADFLRLRHIDLMKIHTSGHAYMQDLKGLVSALNPRCLVPIHTFYPEQYGGFHDNVIQLDDGDYYSL